MERLTEKDNFEKHLGDGMHCDYVKFPDGKCVIYNKLAEYENIGSVEDFKQLSHELEVYKRAFKNEIPSNYYELENVETDEQYIDLRLNKARKELEDESNND